MVIHKKTWKVGSLIYLHFVCWKWSPITCCKQSSLLFYGPICGFQKEVFKIRNIVNMSILIYFMMNSVIATHFFGIFIWTIFRFFAYIESEIENHNHILKTSYMNWIGSHLVLQSVINWLLKNGIYNKIVRRIKIQVKCITIFT
jgi:hypothetical protein